jgi:hypothetical protein
MPTLIIVKGIRFFFYSNEGNEPPHVHVTKGVAYGKIWFQPVSIKYLIGFDPAEEKTILETIMVNLRSFNTKWDEHFN